jgi:hypothetical protein
MNLRQRAVVVVMDILLLAELMVCMYLGQQQGDGLTVFFLKTYLPIGTLTLLSAWCLIRQWRDPVSLCDADRNPEISM